MDATTPKRKKAASYSGKPLATKLGIHANSTILVVGSPSDYLRILGQLPEGVVLADNSSGS